LRPAARSLQSLAVVALGAIAMLAAQPAQAAKKKDPDKLPVTRVLDLHYGDVLFWFYQGESFEALTRLLAYEAWNRIPNHEGESQLLLGGLYLELGLHNEAGQRFEALLTPKVPVNVRNRAWFYLAKVWYARGYDDRAERALGNISGSLQPALEAERQLLLANVLMREGRFADAEKLLTSWKGPDVWTAYARFNLGVALVRQNQLERADAILTGVGTLDSDRSELLALRDKANLALGFAFLQAQQPEKARAALQRVRLNGPQSNKALLGLGWADTALGRYRDSLTPWMELRSRNLLDSAVQESYLAVPYALAKLDATAQAAEYYEQAMTSFEEESKRLDAAVLRIRSGEMLDGILAREADGARYGWFWQLKQVPDAPESRYLYAVMAGHDFQEGLKNYRDMSYLDGTLTRWEGSIEAFNDMIATRDTALAQRLPQADALLAAQPLPPMIARRDAFNAQLEGAQRTGDVSLLGTTTERAQWQKVLAIEQAIAAQPADDSNAEQRAKLRLIKGVLYWRLNQQFKARMLDGRRQLQALETDLQESSERFDRLAGIRDQAGANRQEFTTRLTAMAARLNSLHARLKDTRTLQATYLAELGVRELQQQQERLGTYQVQARYSLAAIYDKAATPDLPAKKPAAEPAAAEPATEAAPAITPMPTPAPEPRP
jgi:hypothetical protein